jgi:hypothetical protein
MAGNVKASHVHGGLQLTIEHPLATKLDPHIVAGCVQALLDCADKNACLQDRFALTAACFETFAKHNAETKCLATGLGVAKH